MTQDCALSILQTGANVFICGAAGSGKTHLLRAYIAYLKEHHVKVAVTASTGIAATHLGGLTLHSWSGIGIKDQIHDDDMAELLERASLRDRLVETKVLIIDEVSMLHNFRLDLVDRMLKKARQNTRPFGGLQVVLCGDLFQLPPISGPGQVGSGFIHTSQSWREGKFAVCYLSTNYRQGHDELTGILNDIRSGDASTKVFEILASRKDISLDKMEPTRLYTHNTDVDAINERELEKSDEALIIYEMSHRGRKPLLESLKRSCLAPEILRLKKGARVMCVKNNADKGYVNGTLGVVVNVAPGLNPVIALSNGKRIEIEPTTWHIEEEGKILAEITQYPLRLAWAITVHKSQGMTLDAVEVDLSKSFEPGMGYVALSRARTLSGLRILGINKMALAVNREILEFDGHLRKLSDKTEATHTALGEKEIAEAQNEFLAQNADLHSRATPKKQNTYDITKDLIAKKKTTKEIAALRDLSVDTVIAHIEELARSKTSVDINYFRYEISAAHWKKIEDALAEIAQKQKDGKPPLLSPVKNLLGPNISFKDIRLARVILGYV